MHTPDRGIYIALLSGGTILLTLIIFFVITIIRYQRRKVAYHKKKIEEEFNYLDKERERIARDLHDDFGSSLSGIKLRLQVMNDLSAANAQIVEGAESAIDVSMEKLRKFSFNLMPATLQREGLKMALYDLLDIIRSTSEISVRYHCDAIDCNNETSAHIYRITQEILNNIVKHAEAGSVDFSLTIEGDTIKLRIADNGKGFNKESYEIQRKGLGLHSIASRVELMHGEWYLNTKENKGTEYLILIPVT